MSQKKSATGVAFSSSYISLCLCISLYLHIHRYFYIHLHLCNYLSTFILLSTFNYVVTCVGLREQRARGRNVSDINAANGSIGRLQLAWKVKATDTAVGGI